jgi:hypothetical protein
MSWANQWVISKLSTWMIRKWVEKWIGRLYSRKWTQFDWQDSINPLAQWTLHPVMEVKTVMRNHRSIQTMTTVKDPPIEVCNNDDIHSSNHRHHLHHDSVSWHHSQMILKPPPLVPTVTADPQLDLATTLLRRPHKQVAERTRVACIAHATCHIASKIIMIQEW